MGGNGAYKGKEIVRNQEKCPETEKAHARKRAYWEDVANKYIILHSTNLSWFMSHICTLSLSLPADVVAQFSTRLQHGCISSAAF